MITLRFNNIEIRDRVADMLDGLDVGYEYGMHTCSLRIDDENLKKVDVALLNNNLMISHGDRDVGFWIKAI